MLPNRKRVLGQAVVGALLALSLCLIGLSVLRGTGEGRAERSPPLRGPTIPSVPEALPQLVKPLTKEDAQTANQAIPVVANALQMAEAFDEEDLLLDPLARRAALDCLTAAVYYEADSEAVVGQRAVAQVVLNRVRHPAFPANVCEVVYQGSERKTGCQFTFTCDGSLARKPNPTGWSRARQIAADALDGSVEASVGMATHYHTNWVVPYWAESLDKIAVVGAHLFYRWRGYWGRRQAFNQRYDIEDALVTPPPVVVMPGLSDAAVETSTIGSPPSALSHLQADLIEPSAAPLLEDNKGGTPSADAEGGVLMADEVVPSPSAAVR